VKGVDLITDFDRTARRLQSKFGMLDEILVATRGTPEMPKMSRDRSNHRLPNGWSQEVEIRRVSGGAQLSGVECSTWAMVAIFSVCHCVLSVALKS
jgi:hypothetical protein